MKTVIVVISLSFRSGFDLFFVIISLFDTVTAITPSWRESSVILSSSTLNESSLSLSASMLSPEAGALLEEPSSPEFVQFIRVRMMKRD